MGSSSSSSCSSFGIRSTGSEEDGDRNGRGKAQELSTDLIVEILVRLPVKTLLRFKSVSKLWYSLITSPNFIAFHSTHSYRKKKVSLLFLRMVFRGPEVTVSFRFDQFVEDLTIPGDNVEIVGCFNGVVCLSLSYRPQRYALWNPATRQLREIEVPKEIEIEVPRFWSNCNGFWSGNGFCFDPVSNSFTVANITLTCAIGGGETRAHIIQFSTATNSWTQKSMGVPFRIWESGKRFTFVCPSISCVNRYMHCHVAVFHDMNDTVADDAYILSYDMIGGVFERIEMPFPPIRCLIQLASCSGSLALFAETVYSRSVEDDAWVMNDCGGADQSWSKLVTYRRPSKVGPGVEVFIKSNDELVIVREPGNMVLLEQCYPYSESLASLY